MDWPKTPRLPMLFSVSEHLSQRTMTKLTVMLKLPITGDSGRRESRTRGGWGGGEAMKLARYFYLR
jgi:hypothetical protein